MATSPPSRNPSAEYCWLNRSQLLPSCKIAAALPGHDKSPVLGHADAGISLRSFFDRVYDELTELNRCFVGQELPSENSPRVSVLIDTLPDDDKIACCINADIRMFLCVLHEPVNQNLGSRRRQRRHRRPVQKYSSRCRSDRLPRDGR